MTTHTKRWIILPKLTPQAEQALSAFSPLGRQLLYNRGYTTEAEARAFLRGEVTFDTNPLNLLGMPEAVARIRHALAHHEPIAIYGDYDVDGVTATALMVDTLRALGGDVRGYIPNRFEEGYGLNNDALTALKDAGVKLVISVDCGIRSPEEAAHARRIGLDLIITDHHHPEADLPPALAVINPKQPGDPYPEKDLAGVGIAYKLAQALAASHPVYGFDPTSLLDLVALGTVADLTPLTGENRNLVRRGLERLRQTNRQGLYSLSNVAGLEIKKINATHIGFMLGPRLNAAGRLESALAAFELLTTPDLMRAGQLAMQLNQQNQQRQRLTQQVQAQAEEIAIKDDPNALLLFAAHPEFNSGIVGLAASRLVEKYYRPAIVAERGPETTRASCRSIPEFHITEALDQCKDLLVRHGGHAAAAGFTIENDKLPDLIARLKEIAAQKLSGLDLRASLTADAEVALHDLPADIMRRLGELEPTGYGNREAVLVSRAVRVAAKRAIGSDGSHLKLTLESNNKRFDAIAFRMGERLNTLPDYVDIMYTLETNTWNGRESLQLNLKDVKAAGLPD